MNTIAIGDDFERKSYDLIKQLINNHHDRPLKELTALVQEI